VQDDGTAFAGVRLQRPLWPHQQRALAALDQSRAAGSASTYLVIPPGGGKTLVGLEAARRLARPTLVLCPNTAIQAQWIAQWDSAFTPAGAMQATASRDLPTTLTVLTYQAVCTIGYGSASTGRQASGKQLLEMVHPNGQALLSRLSARGPWTLVLDECHHLLEIWGRLLAVIVESLAGAHVIGLTATPPHMMTSDQKALHDELFGAIDLEVSAPALVRDGRLAPYQELAYFTTPTRPEADYIHGQAVRFAELRAGLLDPGFAATPFLDWLQRRIVDRREDGSGALVSWERFERDEPALAGAALRLHGDGLLPLPEGARLREQHRRPPAAQDWVALIGDYCRHCLLAGGDPRDERAYEAIRAALPSIGYRLTRTGPRAAESPVDRVLARSASKASAAAEILRAESAELGGRLRALVLTDFIEAGGTVPADLSGVMDEGAGGALLALVTLLADEDGAALDPVLMTGQRVACGTGTARRLADALNASAPGLGATVVPGAGGQAADGQVMDIAGGPGWEPRRYVPLVTRFFADGGSRCLIGTRALLGEGWDAPAVNVVIDLTAATTPTSVVQARGRALRLDDGWPQKVADNWAVICLTADHPKGDADYHRFVRKHDRYFALSGAGDIISGVAHVGHPAGAAACGRLPRAVAGRAGRRVGDVHRRTG
jgi:superfamily II DNA or RNA helicase